LGDRLAANEQYSQKQSVQTTCFIVHRSGVFCCAL
jgi:hypothetical protein